MAAPNLKEHPLNGDETEGTDVDLLTLDPNSVCIACVVCKREWFSNINYNECTICRPS